MARPSSTRRQRRSRSSSSTTGRRICSRSRRSSSRCDQRLVRASSGDEALRRLLERDFAVILLDVQMPGMNGFETARLIKSRERTKYIPIIFLTAISKEEEYVFEGYSVGAVDYLFKPFQPEILRSKVAAFVDLYRASSGNSPRRSRRCCARASGASWSCATCASSASREARFREIVDSAMDAIIVLRRREARSRCSTRRRSACSARRAPRRSAVRSRASSPTKRRQFVSCAYLPTERDGERESTQAPSTQHSRAHRDDAPAAKRFPIEASVSLPRSRAASAPTR